MSSVELGKICKVLNGFAFKSNNYVSDGIRVIRIANVQKGEIVDNDPQFYPVSTKKEIEKYILEEGDLLVSLTGNVGRVGVLQKSLLPAALNQRVACLRIKNKNIVDKRYLFNILNSNYFEHQCISNSQGIAQKNMSTEWLKTFVFNLPSLERQREIAAVLDKASELIEIRKEQLCELDRLAESVFYDMFGDPVTNSKGWEKKQLGELGYFKNGLNFGKNSTLYPIKMLGISDFKDKTVINESDSFDKIYTDVPLNTEYFLNNDDIVFVRSNGSKDLVGRCVIINFENDMAVTFSGFCIRFRKVSNCACALYLFKVLSNKEFRKQLFSKGRGCNINNINQQMLSGLTIPIPPLDLQHQFASIIEKIEAQKAKVKAALKESEDLFQRLMQDMFNPEYHEK